MTFIGKMLALFQVMLGIAFLAWAVALYTNRPAWMGPRKGADSPPSQITLLSDKLKSADAAHQSAALRWYLNSARVVVLEQIRPLRRDFYYEQLRLVRDGTDATGRKVPNAVQTLSTDAAGLIDITRATGRTPEVDRTGQPLRSIRDYLDDTERIRKEILDEHVKIEMSIVALRKESDEILGIDGRKGLRILILDQNDLASRIVQERDFLKNELTNRRVDQLIFARRLRAMREREKEMQDKLGVQSTRLAPVRPE
jgi:hypothetical protein